MHYRLRSVSVPTKLTILAVICVGIAIFLTSLGLSWHSVHSMRQAAVAQLSSQAEMLAFYTAAPLRYQDPTAAQQLLASLESQPAILRALVFDAENRVIASYPPSEQPVVVEPPVKEFATSFNASGDLELTYPIVDDGELLGAVRLVSGLADLRRQQWEYAKLLGLVTFGSLVCSIGLALWLQHHITGPLYRLLHAAQQIASGDYSIRLDCTYHDELGQLCRSFNHMAEQIQSSESKLLHAQSELEDRVASRTYELREEVARREVIQRALVSAKNTAEAANEAKSSFLANMSHEIRTPLNAIIGFSELLKRGQDHLPESDRRQYLDTIETSGQHLMMLINDILDLSKIEAGQMETECIAFCPHELLSQTIDTLQLKGQDKGLKLEYFWTTQVPAKIHSDPARLKQLVLNLLSNAIKFTQNGSVTLVARLDTESDPPHLAIDVIDTGVGIRADKLQAIFDPFVQADNSVTRRFGGTGLGLAISRRIAQALGGDLTVQSVPGVGSTFTATIDPGPLDNVPMLDAPSAGDDVATDGVPQEAEEETEEFLNLPPAKVLLVEDGETNRQLIGIVLGQAGVTVTMAENGAIGVEKATRQAFDLILMDMQMPVMDGYSAARRLRELGSTVPIVALTAHAMTGDEQKCLDAGCTAYLTKPVDCDRLLATVARFLEEQSRQPDAASMAASSTASPPASTGPVVPIPPAPRGVPSSLDRPPSTDATAPISSRLAGDPAFQDVIEVFRTHCRLRVEQLVTAQEQGDLERVRELAHWLRGSAGTAGFDEMTEPATALELAAKAGRGSETQVHLEAVRDLANRLAPGFATPA